jgi:hypothetical protein
MMRASELAVWLSAKPTMIERTDDLSDLICRGYIRVTSDNEAVIALTTTAAAPAPIILPLTAAA